MLTSIIFSVQVYKGGVPRGLRTNIDWWVLGKNKSIATMKDVAEDLTSYATEDQVVRMWEEATSEPFSWFCINLMVPKYRFTKNFDEVVTPNPKVSLD